MQFAILCFNNVFFNIWERIFFLLIHVKAFKKEEMDDSFEILMHFFFQFAVVRAEIDGVLKIGEFAFLCRFVHIYL